MHTQNGFRCELSLPKAQKLAEYMTGEEFVEIMEQLCKHACIMRVKTGDIEFNKP